MSKDGDAGKQPDEMADKRRKATAAVEAIIAKGGAATKGDIDAARKLNSMFLGGEFTDGIEATAREAAAAEAAKTTPAPEVDPAKEPFAAAKAYDKFLKSAEMQQVLSVHEQIAQGKTPTNEALATSTKTLAQKQKEQDKLHKAAEARETVLAAKIKEGKATSKEKEEFKILHDQITVGKKNNAHLRVAEKTAKEAGRTLDEIDQVLASSGSAIKMAKDINGEHVAIDRERDLRLRDVMGQNKTPPAKEAERTAAPSAGKKKKAGFGSVEGNLKSNSKTETRNPGDPLPSPITPDKKGASKGTDVRMP